MEIEQKERERIWRKCGPDNTNNIFGHDVNDHGVDCAIEEHLHLQKEVIQPMQSVIIAAAEEIQRCWPAHCDAEGYGPANLMRRLEKGIPSQYGYTAGAFAKLEAENKALREAAGKLVKAIKHSRYNPSDKAMTDERKAYNKLDQLLTKNVVKPGDAELNATTDL